MVKKESIGMYDIMYVFKTLFFSVEVDAIDVDATEVKIYVNFKPLQNVKSFTWR